MADTARTKGKSHAADAIEVRSIVVGASVVASAIVFAFVASYIAIHAGGTANGISFSGAQLEAPSAAARSSLQPHPSADIAAYRAEKQRLLESYAWIDRANGIVRIPIRRAMDLSAGDVKIEGTAR